MNDVTAFTATVLAFAVCVTAHVLLVIGLARRPPRARALVAFFVFPFAPYWGVREGMRLRASAWVVGLVVYLGALALQRR